MKDVAETVVISSWQEYIEFNVQKDDWFGNLKVENRFIFISFFY